MDAQASWPVSGEELCERQRQLAAECPPPWNPPPQPYAIGGCFVCYMRGADPPGASGECGWAGAAVLQAGRLLARAVAPGRARSAYASGLLALRDGPLLEAAVEALAQEPDVLIVDATGRDHPRRAGLAMQLGAVLGLATVGVTHRPLLARGAWPVAQERGATSPLLLDGATVACWLRTRAGARPLAVHAGWSASLEQAREVVLLAAARGVRAPEPLREARRLARIARAGAHGGARGPS